MTSQTQQLGPALDIDARLTEIERSLNLLLNVTPVNAAAAWADFERSDFGTVPTLGLRPLQFEPDLVRRDLYNLEIENVTDPALHTLFRAKRDEIARQITALEDRSVTWNSGIVEAMSKKLVADGMYVRRRRCDRGQGRGDQRGEPGRDAERRKGCTRSIFMTSERAACDC